MSAPATDRYPFRPDHADPTVEARNRDLAAFLTQIDTRERTYTAPIPDDQEEFL